MYFSNAVEEDWWDMQIDSHITYLYDNAIQKMKKHMTFPDVGNYHKFAKILATCYYESERDAKDLVDQIGLTTENLMAIVDDRQGILDYIVELQENNF